MAADVALAPRAPFDRALLLVVPAALFMVLLFIYPFVYGLLLSFEPAQGGALANYRKFFTTDNLWPTIWTTLKLALPATIVNVGIALPSLTGCGRSRAGNASSPRCSSCRSRWVPY